MYRQTHTLGECKDTVFQMLERYSHNGTTYSGGEKADLEARFLPSVNRHLRKLSFEYPGPVETARMVFPTARPAFELENVDLRDGDSRTRLFSGYDLAFYGRFLGSGFVTFTVAGETTTFPFDADFGTPQVLRGYLGQFGDTIQFSVACASHGVVEQLVVYDGFSSLDTDVNDPELIPAPGFSTLSLPKNFLKLVRVTNEAGEKVDEAIFSFDSDHVTVRAADAGRYVFEYRALPEPLTDSSAPATPLPLPAMLFDALCYLVAADLCPSGDGDLFAKLTYKAREVLENYYDASPLRREGRNRFFGAKRTRRPL